MRFSILGPLSVTDDEQPVAVTAGRDRVVLAMLLLRPGRVLSVGSLVDAVWGADPPATARGQLQTCVSRLRRALPPGVIESDPAGYRIEVGADELDAVVFGRLFARARAQGDPALFRQALDLWRGDALAGIDSHAVRLAAAALDEQRVAALEEWAELELAAGRERDLIGELTELVERFPLQERLREHLMTALYRSGRQADALAEYRRAREVLRGELGLEPGKALQDLHAAMLAGDLPAPAPPAPVRCLPRTVRDFTGRGAVVDRLVRAVSATDGSAGPGIAVIDGMAGSGKTTLALHVAALVGDRYPDAHLFVDLHGHSEQQPLEPAAALLILLRQLGVGAERIPAALVDRVGLWRTELASRRVLVLFDNAASSTQLTDLLPTSPASLALVTSRRRLAGLDGVHTEPLPVLGEEEAITLLARIAGERVQAEPGAAADVVRRCGGLPLAIRLAGARLAHRPKWRVADLVRRLGEATLPELAAEDRTVAGAFALSYGQLPERVQRIFRLLGVYPGADFDDLGLAALTGLPIGEARDVLDDLVDVHLVEEPEPGVFRLHDLLREYAAALAVEMPDDERTAALTGVLDLQLHAAAATSSVAYRSVLDRDLRSPRPARPDLLAVLADPAARLERERRNLAGYVDAAIGAGLLPYAWQIPRASWRHLYYRGYLDDIALLFRRALSITEQIGDRSATATCANYLGSVHFRWADLEEARRLLMLSIRIRDELGERAAMVTAMGNLASIYHNLGRWEEAIEVARTAQRMSPAQHSPGESSTRLNVLGLASLQLGRYADALHYMRIRLMLLIALKDLALTSECLSELANVKYRVGAIGLAAARRQILVGLRLALRMDYPGGEGSARNRLAGLLCQEGRFAEALVEHRLALQASLQMHDRIYEAVFRCDLATTLRLSGDGLGAAAMLHEALRVARAAHLPYYIALAQAGLAECAALDDPDEARRLWSSALDTFRKLSAPERFEVEQRLADLEGGGDQLRIGADGGTITA